MKRILSFFSFLFLFLSFSVQGFAIEAQVINPEAIIYAEPDFDSELLTYFEQGQKIEVSQKKFGPFHRVKIDDKNMGYIADNDFIFLKIPPSKTIKDQNKSELNKKETSTVDKKNDELEKSIGEESEKVKNKNVDSLKEREIKKKTTDFQKYSLEKISLQGPNFSYTLYREETMGMTPTQNSFFWGYKWIGPKLLSEMDTHTELNVMFRKGAPEFYAQATGRDTQGWIFLPDILIQNVQPQSRNLYSTYGYGLMFRYSKYDVGLSNGSGGVNNYSLEDMVLGAVGSAGLVLRLGDVTLRGEFKYYFEKSSYWGMNLAFLFPFR